MDAFKVSTSTAISTIQLLLVIDVTQIRLTFTLMLEALCNLLQMNAKEMTYRLLIYMKLSNNQHAEVPTHDKIFPSASNRMNSKQKQQLSEKNI